MLAAYVQGIGVLGPGLADWAACAAALRVPGSYHRTGTMIPALAVLPAAERRRAGRVVRVALAVGAEAVAHARADARCLPSVFTSSGGDGDNCHALCETLAGTERLISPTRFHNSVHNAAAGYWGIAYGCTQPCTALCAHDASFGAGLIEALSQLAGGAQAVLLVSYDLDYPPPLRAHRAIGDACAVALLLRSAAAAATATGPRLRVDFTDAPATALTDGALESLRLEIPAARALPLLGVLAGGSGGHAVLDYLEDMRLDVHVDAGAAGEAAP